MAKLKITDSEVIKSGERELLDIIIGDLDWNSIEKIVKEKHQLRIQDDVEFRKGDIVVYNNTVAYKFDFDVKVTLTVLFDRDGNYLSFSTSGDFIEDAVTQESEDSDLNSGPETDRVDSDVQIEVQSQDNEETIEEEIPGFENSSAPEDNLEPEKEAIAENTADMVEGINREEVMRFDPSKPPPSFDPEKDIDENMSGMATQIADMLADINENDEE